MHVLRPEMSFWYSIPERILHYKSRLYILSGTATKAMPTYCNQIKWFSFRVYIKANRQWSNQKYNIDIIYIGIVFIRLDVVEHIDFQ